MSFYDSKWRNRLPKYAGNLAWITLAATVLLVFLYIFGHIQRVIIWVLLVIWIILPPIWFWFEFFYLHKPNRIAGKEDKDLFEYGQKVSGTMWAGIVTLLIVLLAKT